MRLCNGYSPLLSTVYQTSPLQAIAFFIFNTHRGQNC